MKVHKILTGEGAEKYLPFALSKLRFLMSSSHTIVVQKYQIDDAVISVEMNPLAGQHFVRIDATSGSVGYEFFSTFDAVTSFPVAWRAVAVVPQPDAADTPLKASKLSSAFIDGPAPVVPRDPVAKAVNGQRNPEYHWWPAKPGGTSTDAVRTAPWFMTSTLGVQAWQAHELDGQSFMASFTTKDGVTAVPYEFGSDVGVDVPPTIYEKGTALSAQPVPSLPNWVRRAAAMEVGGRRFVIMSDMQSNFYAWPASYMTPSPVKDGFHASRAKVIRAADYMPAGVTRPTVETMSKRARGVIVPYTTGSWAAPEVPAADIVAPYAEYPGASVEPGADETRQHQRHHYLWDFHPSGTKAVAVVHTDTRALTVDRGEGREPLTALAEYGPQYRIRAALAGSQWVVAAGGAQQVEASTHDALEVTFGINITGPGEDDFTFEITNTHLFGDGWYMDAQYVYPDSRLEALGVPAGELVVDELRLYGKKPPAAPAPEVHDAYIVTYCPIQARDVVTHCVAMNRPFYMQDRFRSVWASLGTYPGTPPSIWRYDLMESSPVGAHGVARMIASDLRSMSKVFQQSRDGSPAGLHAVVFGETRRGAGLPRTPAESLADGLEKLPAQFLPSGSSWMGGASFPADDEAAAHTLALHRLVWEQSTASYGFDGSVHNAIASHPDGHFAVFAHYYDGADVFDLIEYRRVKLVGGVPTEVFDRTTHADALREAFGIELDPADYAARVTTTEPFVVQRFASWRNVKLPKLPGSPGYFGMNPRLGDPI